jgi:hypothetical protein
MPIRTIKQKDFSNKKAKTASQIQPVIVINGYTLRPVIACKDYYIKQILI